MASIANDVTLFGQNNEDHDKNSLKQTSLEVDALQKNQRMALIQDGKPVAFGSKTLTDT